MNRLLWLAFRNIRHVNGIDIHFAFNYHLAYFRIQDVGLKLVSRVASMEMTRSMSGFPSGSVMVPSTMAWVLSSPTTLSTLTSSFVK